MQPTFLLGVLLAIGGNLCIACSLTGCPSISPLAGIAIASLSCSMRDPAARGKEKRTESRWDAILTHRPRRFSSRCCPPLPSLPTGTRWRVRRHHGAVGW